MDWLQDKGNGQADFSATFLPSASLKHLFSFKILPECLSLLNFTNVGFSKSCFRTLFLKQCRTLCGLIVEHIIKLREDLGQCIH